MIQTRFIIKPFLLALILCLHSCYFVDFFKSAEDSSTGSESSEEGSRNIERPVLGDPLGSKAGGPDEAALAAVHSETSEIPPASIRADPDLYARRLLLQYRSEGSTVAREIGSIEGFRLLLGGASEDFQRTPQENFDATSLLANISVAERVCEGLVAPDANRHQGWTSILPASPDQWEVNFKFLAQRLLGKPSSGVTDSQLTALKEIMDSFTVGSRYTYRSYIPVCTTLAMDAESLLL